MKKPAVTVISVLWFVSLCACASIGGGTNTGGNTVQAKGQYYTGDGGEGMSIAILVPEGRGIAAAQNYLPTLVQGVFVGDITRYSAITVLDRQSLEKVLKETESGIYQNEADFIQLGQITNVGYALTGSVTKTGSGYALQIQITDTAPGRGTAKASYSGTCTVEELDNFSAIRKASAELLTQMGVTLTAAAREELSGAGTERYVNAQTALSKGIIAQRDGQTVQSLAYYYQAKEYDPSFKEAAARVNTLSYAVSTGSLGQDLQNDIAWRREWKKLLDEAWIYFFTNRPPPEEAELLLYTNLKQGKIDYIEGKETVEFTNSLALRKFSPPDNVTAANKKIRDDLLKGLAATGRNSDWGLSVPKYLGPQKPFAEYSCLLELINGQGKVVAKSGLDFSGRQYDLANSYFKGSIFVVSVFVVPVKDVIGNMTVKVTEITATPSWYHKMLITRGLNPIIPVRVVSAR